MLARGVQSRLIRGAALVMFGASMAGAQKHPAAFGRISEVSVNFSPSGILAADFNGDSRTDVAAYGMGQLAILTTDAGGELVLSKSVRSLGQTDRIISEDLNKDRIPDLIVGGANPQSVRVFVGTRDTFLLRWNSELPQDAENLFVEDINNDRKPDLVAFGKKMLGLLALLGQGDGEFSAPQLMLEEYSFQALVVDDLNGDRVADMAGYDWVNNHLLVFSGLGRMRFSEPSTVDLPGELSDIKVTFANSDANPDLLVLSKDPNELISYNGDGLGGFTPVFRRPLHSGGRRLVLHDIDRNGRTDAIIFSRNDRSFSILLNNGDGTFHRGTTYAAGPHPDELAALYDARTRETSIAVLDRTSRTVLMFRSNPYPGPPAAGQTYALGPRPNGITAADVNRDSFNDLLVANSGAEHVSLFFNRRDGTFDAQIPIPVKISGEALYAVRKNDSTMVCVTVHPAFEMLTLAEVVWPGLQSTLLEIPTGNSPELLSIRYQQDSQLLTLLASTKDTISGRRAISAIRQLDHKNFVEEVFFASGEQTVMAADVFDMNRDGITDVVYLAFDSTRKSAGLHTTLARTMSGFSVPHRSFSVPVTDAENGRLWIADFDSDAARNLILHHVSDDGYLSFAHRLNDSTFIQAGQQFSQVIVRARKDVAFADIDGNGFTDVIVANTLKNMIQVYLQKSDGGFLPPRRVVSWSGDGGFVVSDLNNDGVQDYAIVYSESGIMRVFLGSE